MKMKFDITKHKHVYLSGPISGIDNDNEEEFEKYEGIFRRLDVNVINPLKLFTKQEKQHLQHLVDTKQITKEQMYDTFMRRDIEFMMRCDFVAMLPNWESSNGANIEIRVARFVRMHVIDARDFSTIEKTF